MAFYLGSMRFMDFIEPHNPARVLRQMGYVQGIPKKPYKPIYADRSKLAHTYSVKYDYDPQVWEEWKDHLITRERRGERYFHGKPHQRTFNGFSQRAINLLKILNSVTIEHLSLPKTNVMAENAISMADAVISFLSGVEEEEKDMVTAITTQSDGATTSTAWEVMVTSKRRRWESKWFGEPASEIIDVEERDG
ncbi:hypothetical protein Syun_006663 [Stephania yunnanensis]|uniref:Uncharacterized protein n=1 Tax=Stephania yunnanensis TaxID=152371 RepID=A0AAP0KYP7_9MAGN